MLWFVTICFAIFCYRAGVKGVVVLTPLLGTNWIFGLLAVNRDLVVFEFLFVILNSFQGLFIFLFHCVGSSEVGLITLMLYITTLLVNRALLMSCITTLLVNRALLMSCITTLLVLVGLITPNVLYYYSISTCRTYYP